MGRAVGVAPGAKVVAVRVLDCEGSGAISDVVAGASLVLLGVICIWRLLVWVGLTSAGKVLCTAVLTTLALYRPQSPSHPPTHTPTPRPNPKLWTGLHHTHTSLRW